MSGNKRKVHLIVQLRDRRLLTELATMQIIDREFAKVVAGFASTTRANTRLLKLTRAGLLNRFFIGSVAAGRKSIYTLSPRGGQLSGVEYRRISRSHGKTLVGDLFIDHQMKINEIYVSVKFRRSPDSSRFLLWRSFHRPLTENTKVVPDGYFELSTTAGIRPMFLEVDLGHQSMKVWEQKIRQYLQLALSGDFARLFRQSQFRVLVITTSERRRKKIAAVMAKQTDKIFWLSDFQSINQRGMWASVWHRPTGQQPQPLI